MHVFIMVLLLNLSPLTMQVGAEFTSVAACKKGVEFVVSQDASLKDKVKCFELVLEGGV